jgi:hypothetical protein
MKYNTIFEIEPFFIDTIHLIMCIFCLFLIGYVIYSFKKKLPIINKILSTVMLSVSIFITAYTISTSNTVALELYNMMKNNECEIVAGEVEEFHTPSIYGHDQESFFINNVYFKYSNSVEVGYSKTRNFGGVVTGNGQYLRITYVQIEEENVILKIEEVLE